ncbi:MAG: hypothetical protein V7K71_30590 [Nostoc sp.]|uniref:hypothetical protein n=1 Tax=Nostoc sp. TaxID=1180 RepID=UPI002FFC79DD
MVYPSKNNTEVTANLRELADYTKSGVTRKALVKDEQNSFSLLCLTGAMRFCEVGQKKCDAFGGLRLR